MSPRILLHPVLARFIAWWLAELAAVAAAVAGAVPSRAGRRPRVVLTVVGDRLTLHEERGATRRPLAAAHMGASTERDRSPPATAAMVDALRAIAARADRPAVTLCLPRAACFSRRLTLPASAVREIAQLLRLDLEQATPFRHRDVVTAYRLLPDAATSGRIVVEQVIVKRTVVAGATGLLAVAGLSVGHIASMDDDRGAPAVSYIADSNGDSRGGEGAARASFPPSPWMATGLAAAAVALLIAAATIACMRLEAIADTAAAEARLARTRHASIATDHRRRIEERQRRTALIALRTGTGSRAATLDALTRLLPDSDHLTSLRIDGRRAELIGISAATATLLPAIERSPMFARATLTTPVTVDDRTGRERFSLAVDIEPSAEGAAVPLETGSLRAVGTDVSAVRGATDGGTVR